MGLPEHGVKEKVAINHVRAMMYNLRVANSKYRQLDLLRPIGCQSASRPFPIYYPMIGTYSDQKEMDPSG